MGETAEISACRPVKLEELMREQDGELEQGSKIRNILAIDSRKLYELLHEEEIDADVGVEAGEKEGRNRRKGFCQREKIMEGLRGGRRWKSFKKRLSLKGMGFCGSSWSFSSEQMNVNVEMGEDVNTDIVGEAELSINMPQNGLDLAGAENEEQVVVAGVEGRVGQMPAVAGGVGSGGEAGNGMNLAAALAAERHFRAAQEWEAVNMAKPLRVSLLRLLEEVDDGGFLKSEEEKGNGVVGGGEGEGLCCVCMARIKGAAFIPCGHTFCRVCSRELWLNRGSCAICNSSILEILDIF